MHKVKQFVVEVFKEAHVNIGLLVGSVIIALILLHIKGGK